MFSIKNYISVFHLCSMNTTMHHGIKDRCIHTRSYEMGSDVHYSVSLYSFYLRITIKIMKSEVSIDT